MKRLFFKYFLLTILLLMNLGCTSVPYSYNALKADIEIFDMGTGLITNANLNYTNFLSEYNLLSNQIAQNVQIEEEREIDNLKNKKTLNAWDTVNSQKDVGLYWLYDDYTNKIMSETIVYANPFLWNMENIIIIETNKLDEQALSEADKILLEQYESIYKALESFILNY